MQPEPIKTTSDKGDCLGNDQILNGKIYDWGTVVLPEGIKISKGKYGYCLEATKNFKKGEQIYEIIQLGVPVTYQAYKFKVGQDEYFGDSTNIVSYNGYKEIYTFVGFCNHSCDSNSRYKQIQSTNKYIQIATKDINVGQEITTNYMTFDYLCQGHQFKCQCGATNCFGEIKGFKNLSVEGKLIVLPEVDAYLTKQWLELDQKLFLVDYMILPKGIKIISDTKDHKVQSERNLKAGEIFFQFEAPIINKKNPVLIYKVGQKFYKWNPENKITEKNQEYFSCFRVLFNESNQPNLKLSLKEGYIIGECLEQIKQGDQLTITKQI